MKKVWVKVDTLSLRRLADGRVTALCAFQGVYDWMFPDTFLKVLLDDLLIDEEGTWWRGRSTMKVSGTECGYRAVNVILAKGFYLKPKSPDPGAMPYVGRGPRVVVQVSKGEVRLRE